MSATHSKSRSKPSDASAVPARHHGRGMMGPSLLSLGVQRQVVIGRADDPFEREADRVSDHILSGQTAPPISPLGPSSLNGGGLQRQEEEEEAVQTLPVQRQVEEEEEAIQTLPVQRQVEEEEEAIQTLPVQRQTKEEEEPVQTLAIQRQAEEEEPVQTLPVQRQTKEEEEEEPVQTLPIQRQEEEIQTKDGGSSGAGIGGHSSSGPNSGGGEGRSGAGTPSMQAAAGQAIHSGSPGHPLQPGTQARLEKSIGVDFRRVRVHTDSRAHQASKVLHARAFTHGHHIWLGPGESPNDLALMAHESAHVVQQDGLVHRQPLDDEETRPSSNGTLPTNPALPAEPPPPPVEPATETGGAGLPTAPLGAPISEPLAPATPEGNGVMPGAAAGEVTEEAVEGEEVARGEDATPAGAAPGGPAGAGPAPAAEPSPSEFDDLLPEEPSGLTEEDQAELSGVQGRVGQTARAESDLPGADANTEGARGAVEEPETETAARAQGELVAALATRAEPSPEIEELCARIKEVIESKRPPDEESLLRHNPEEAANEAGSTLNQSIEGEADNVREGYSELETPPEGEPQLDPQEPEVPPGSVPGPEINAEAGAPTPIPEENLSFQGAVDDSQQRIEEAGMNTRVAQEVDSGPVADARETQSELEEEAVQSEEAIIAEQEAAISNAQNNMAALQQQALQRLNASRRSSIEGTSGQQTSMVESETVTRESVSARAEEIFNTARDDVNALLDPLAGNAMERWNTEKARLSREFESTLADVDDWIEERHSGVLGGIVSFFDNAFGYPDWIVDEYDRAEREFGDGVCDVLREISREVNSVIATCEEIIANAKQEIDDLFNNLPEELQEWAAGERARFQERLDGLQNQVTEARNNINQDLSREASQAVEDVRQEIHARREAAKGLLGRIADAIGEFLEDPIRAIINGLLKLAGIEPSRFWALVNRIQQVASDIADDPEGFANNLFAAIGQGFQQFFDNFATHLFNGFFEWLFSGLGSVGVEIPSDFSLKSLITFILQLMGISWAKIRALLAKHIGEENVALIEKAWEIVSTLIQQGPEGIFELIKEQLNPQNILNMIIDAAIDYMIEALIKQVTVRVIALFNPVGAIVQAVQAIYKVVKWIFENAARIFTLIETVVNGLADIIAGNIGGMADAVENALAGLMAPVIGFFMDLVGLGDLPDKVADTIRGFQEWVEGILDRVIGWLAEQGRKLLSALGLGKDEEETMETGDVKDQAKAAITQRLSQGDSLDDAQSSVDEVFNQLRDQGLTLLQIGPEDADGEFTIYAAASARDPLLKLAPKRRKVRMVARVTVEGEAAPLAGSNVRLGREFRRSESGEMAESQLPAPIAPVTGRSRMGGVVVPPTSPDTIEVVSWNTGDIDPRVESNASHAERQFVEWFNGQPADWRRRVKEIHININFSPCIFCASDLQNVRAPSLESASVTYDKVYTQGRLATTDASLSQMTKWQVNGPPVSSEEEHLAPQPV